MSNMTVVARRTLVLLALAAGVVALLAARRSPSRRDTLSPPQWPPFEPVVAAGSAAPAPSTENSPLPWRLARADEPEAPAGFPVKVKVSSGIYHTPGGRFYGRTRPDRWYATAEAAEADGYRRSKT